MNINDFYVPEIAATLRTSPQVFCWKVQRDDSSLYLGWSFF
jgi:hypothetical protein